MFGRRRVRPLQCSRADRHEPGAVRRAISGVLERRHHRQGGLGALVRVAPAGRQRVTAAASARVVEGQVGVVVAQEPVDGSVQAVGPPVVAGQLERPPAGVGQRRRPRSVAGRRRAAARPVPNHPLVSPTGGPRRFPGRATNPEDPSRQPRRRHRPVPIRPRSTLRRSRRWRSSGAAVATATRY